MSDVSTNHAQRLAAEIRNEDLTFRESAEARESGRNSWGGKDPAYPTILFRPLSVGDVAARDYDDDADRAKSLARDLRDCGWEAMADEFSRLGFVAFLAARAERLSCEPV